jgi:hypothetical protein
MMKNKLLSALILGTSFALATPMVASAEYITALEDIHYEKYVVDTSSIFYPNPEDHRSQFNVTVYYYNDIKNPDKNQMYTFKFKFDEKNMQWLIHTSEDKWETVEAKSVASDILRTCIPYLK